MYLPLNISSLAKTLGRVTSFLLILCMKRLHINIDEVVREKTWDSIGISISGHKFFFAYDLTLSMWTEEKNVTLSKILVMP